VTFYERRPGVASGLSLAFDFRDPENPDGKPPAIALIEIELQEGARFDTGALPQCSASDAEIMAQGAAACPPESQTGAGTLLTDTGAIGGLPREVTNTLTQFNDDGEAITLAESQNPQTRVVSRATIEGNRVTIPIPPVPGGPPPDPFTAFKTFRLDGEAPRSGPALLTSPPNCPAAGSWTNRLTFTYRDGVSESVESLSPCRQPRPATDRIAPAIKLSGVPGRPCQRRAFVARVRIVDSSRTRSRLLVDGRRERSVRRAARFRERIPVGRLAPGIHRIEVRSTDGSGNSSARTVRFRRCGSGGRAR